MKYYSEAHVRLIGHNSLSGLINEPEIGHYSEDWAPRGSSKAEIKAATKRINELRKADREQLKKAFKAEQASLASLAAPAIEAAKIREAREASKSERVAAYAAQIAQTGQFTYLPSASDEYLTKITQLAEIC